MSKRDLAYARKRARFMKGPGKSGVSNAGPLMAIPSVAPVQNQQRQAVLERQLKQQQDLLQVQEQERRQRKISRENELRELEAQKRQERMRIEAELEAERRAEDELVRQRDEIIRREQDRIRQQEALRREQEQEHALRSQARAMLDTDLRSKRQLPQPIVGESGGQAVASGNGLDRGGSNWGPGAGLSDTLKAREKRQKQEEYKRALDLQNAQRVAKGQTTFAVQAPRRETGKSITEEDLTTR